VDVRDFDFELPEELIAQYPPEQRGQSRLMVLSRDAGVVAHATFDRLGDYLRAGDLLVLNDTRVFPARLLGHREPSGGAVECLLLGRTSDPRSEPQSSLSGPPPQSSGGAEPEYWQALVHPGQKLKPGARVVFEGGGVSLKAEVLDRHFHGRRTIRLWTDDGSVISDVIERIGHIPLPPYIHRADEPSDRERYQTIYASARGSIAAPTAGLHFTTTLFDDLRLRGVESTTITLHVGYGTFKPVRVDRVEDHQVDAETFTVPAAAAEAMTRALAERRRIIAVGTTTTRALESLAVDAGGRIQAKGGSTALFIRPGHEFRIVQGLITNFHLPRSSLLMLVAAFAGRERILAAYHEAVERQYRFYSYGDAMLIL